MSDLFDDLEFEVLGEDFEDPFESMAGGQNLPPPPEILAPQVQPASAVLQKEESILDAGADHAPETPPPAFSEIHAAEPEDTEEERPAAGSKGGTSSEPAGTAAVNMMAAMAEEAEAATAQQDSRTLMELPPVFKYIECENGDTFTVFCDKQDDAFRAGTVLTNLRVRQRPGKDDPNRIFNTLESYRVASVA